MYAVLPDLIHAVDFARTLSESPVLLCAIGLHRVAVTGDIPGCEGFEAGD